MRTSNHEILLNRRNAWKTIAPAVIAMGLPAAAIGADGLLTWLGGQRPRKLLVGLLDVSSSPSQQDASELYHRGLKAFFQSAQVADELLATTVGNAGIGEVQMKIVPLASTGKVFQDKKNVREGVASVLSWLENQPRGRPSSRYLETLAALQPAIMKAAKSGVGVDVFIAGDGIENSQLGGQLTNFERPYNTKKLVDYLAQNKLLLTAPEDMKGGGHVRLMFVGVGGMTDQTFSRCRDFWAGYATASKVDLTYFGRDMPPFFGG